VAGYHLHFLDEHRSRGGHALDFEISHGDVHICILSELHLSLPRTPAFLAATLTAADSAEQIRQAEGEEDPAGQLPAACVVLRISHRSSRFPRDCGSVLLIEVEGLTEAVANPPPLHSHHATATRPPIDSAAGR